MSPTYILLPKNPTNVDASREVMKFFDWAYGRATRWPSGYRAVPLPEAVVEAVKADFQKSTSEELGRQAVF